MLDLSLSKAQIHQDIEEQLQKQFYYHPEWLALLSRLYGYSVIPVTSRDEEGRVSGVLMLCLMSSPLTGKRMVSLPFSDTCPLLATSDSVAADLVDQALSLARQYRVRYVELRTGQHPVLDKRSDMVSNDLYVRWVLPLGGGSTALWSALRKPVQRQIKKAQNQGVTIRVAQQREDVELYYHLHLLTRSKKQGMPAQPRAFFYGLWDAFAAEKKMQILLAEHEGKCIAGMVLLASDTTIRYAYGASDERYLNLAPNNLLMWTAISNACTDGYQSFDFGRTARDNHGLMEFKRRWGAAQEPLIYYYHPQAAGLASVSETSWKFRVLTNCWRKLPLPVAGALGGRLYKHLG